MRQSQLFTKTRREAPKDEVAKNAELLIRAGFIHKELAGVYSYLPLGLRVLENIVKVIREEMNAIGGQELYLTALQDPNVWKKTGRWDSAAVDNWFKTKLKNESELGLGFTHEEPLTNLMKDYISSFRDLPFSVYQFQTKFRNEARAKSGIMRTREFLMKDLYSFSRDEEEHKVFYEKAKNAYFKIFDRLGLGDKTFITAAPGGSFSKHSQEFQTLSDTGEDLIYIDGKDKSKKVAINKEILEDEEVLKELGLKKENLVEKKAVEVGNIFNLGTKFSDAFELKYLDSEGKKKPVVMGSYGIGPGRVMGVMAETMSDEHGLVWPKGIASFDVHLVVIFDKEGKAKKEADTLYDDLIKKGISVLYDDRDLRTGEKFADSDLIGIPTRIVVSEKNLKEGKFEVKDRKSGEVKMVGKEELDKILVK
jgi:prolyl-tRNA synthetase